MNSDWASLCHNLLDLVLQRLISPTNYLRASLVCKSWYGGAKNYKEQLAKISSCDRSPPMLLIPTGKNGIWRPFNVMDDRLLGSQLKLGKRRFCGSSKGWLIAVEKDFTVSPINPFLRYKGTRMKENSIIRLPPINPPNFNKHKWADISDHLVFKASISTDPILNSADCIVAVIYEGFRRLAFIRLGKERTWIYADGRHTLIEEVVFVEDKCYAVDNWSILLSFDVTTRSNPNVKVVAKGIKGTGNTTRYLVALNEGNFLMVHRTYYFDYERNKRETGKIKVFELDLKECKWIEKDTLGGISLFAGDNSTIYVLTSELSGWQPNCIYLNHDNDFASIDLGPNRPCVPHDYGVYNVETQSFSNSYSTRVKTQMKNAHKPAIWIVPASQL